MKSGDRSVLFVCTGNIFRSLTAERALRRALGGASRITVASAGTAHEPDLSVRSDVAAYLLRQGLDVSDHRRRTLTPELVNNAHLVIAMNSDHRRFLAKQHGIDAPLYTAATGGASEDLPDVNDLFQPEEYLSAAAVQHVREIIDRIIAGAPSLAQRITQGAI